MELVFNRLSKFETEAGRLAGLAYEPRPNDVVISTTPKAGTTWMQQICHQLRSADMGGDMSFVEISAAVPWLELAADQGQDLEAPQYGQAEGKPRLFKTHCWEEHCPKFPKTIVVLRDPYDVVKSFYHFFEDWFFERGSISIDEFANDFWLTRNAPKSKMENASYFVHLTSWYHRRNDPSVLFVFFEDLKAHLEDEVRRVAAFLSCDSCRLDTDDRVALATKHATFDFMKAHESQFDEKLSKLARNEAAGLAKDAGMRRSKILRGQSGLDNGLSDDTKAKIAAKWKEVVEPVTGCANYEELRQQFHSQFM